MKMLIAYITEDFERMSEAAARLLLPKMRQATIDRKVMFNLGLATGNSPTGLYKRLAERQDLFDARKVRTFNLDEYVGLPGETASSRVIHPESYAYFMVKNLFGRLEPGFAETHVPPGTEIDQVRLEEALEKNQVYVKYDGKGKGKAIVISAQCTDPYLCWVRDQLLGNYFTDIKRAGGIDTWVVGIGGRAHIAFHESGISYEQPTLLVKLDPNTIENAVKDGHFPSVEESPRYALSMGAQGIVNVAKNVFLFANGERKTDPIAESLLGPISEDVPASILQKYIGTRYDSAIYVLDEVAAGGILGKERVLRDKGILVRDIRAKL